MTSTFIKRNHNQKILFETKKHIFFGLFYALIFMTISIWNILFVVGSSYLGWSILFIIGFLFFLSAFIFPDYLRIPEKLTRIVLNIFGTIIFNFLLIVVYFLFISPMGLILGKIKGNHPFYSYERKQELLLSTYWEPKKVVVLTGNMQGRKRNVVFLFGDLIIFFATHKEWLLLPIIIILAVLGIMLFFVQTSVIAPTIYTIF